MGQIYSYSVIILWNKTREIVNEMATHTGTRKHYSSLVAILRRMSKMDGGPEKVASIVEMWKTIYRNRPAMMDELRKL